MKQWGDAKEGRDTNSKGQVKLGKGPLSFSCKGNYDLEKRAVKWGETLDSKRHALKFALWTITDSPKRIIIWDERECSYPSWIQMLHEGLDIHHLSYKPTARRPAPCRLTAEPECSDVPQNRAFNY